MAARSSSGVGGRATEVLAPLRKQSAQLGSGVLGVLERTLEGGVDGKLGVLLENHRITGSSPDVHQVHAMLLQRLRGVWTGLQGSAAFVTLHNRRARICRAYKRLLRVEHRALDR